MQNRVDGANVIPWELEATIGGKGTGKLVSRGFKGEETSSGRKYRVVTDLFDIPCGLLLREGPRSTPVGVQLLSNDGIRCGQSGSTTDAS